MTVDLAIRSQLMDEFPEWDIVRAGDKWSATWKSEDGRSLHYVVNATPADLLAKLRSIRAEQ